MTQPTTMILDRYLASCQTLDLEAITACFAESAHIHDPTGTISGRSAIHAYFAAIYRELKALEFELGNLYWCENSCAIQWHGRATQHDGKVKHYEGIDVFTLNSNGFISEMRAYWDPALLAA